MKTHKKARSMIMVSPHPKVLSLEVQAYKPLNQQRTRIYHKSFQEYKKDIILFKLIKNQFPPNSNFSFSKEADSDPFRMPTRTRDRKQKRYLDFEFKDLLSREPERPQRVRFSPDLDSGKKTVYEQVHYVRQFKARNAISRQRGKEKTNSALLICKKQLMPVVSNRMQTQHSYDT